MIHYPGYKKNHSFSDNTPSVAEVCLLSLPLTKYPLSQRTKICVHGRSASRRKQMPKKDMQTSPL